MARLLSPLRYAIHARPDLLPGALWPLAAGAFLLFALLARLRRAVRRLSCSREADAVVERIEDAPRGRRRYVLRFAAGGQEVRCVRTVSFSRDVFSQGQSLSVRYSPANPAGRQIVEELDARGSLAPAGALVLALLLLAMTPAQRAYMRQAWDVRELLQRARPEPRTEEPVRSGAFEYTLQADGTAVLSLYRGNEPSVTLPVILDGHLVKGVSPRAFFGSLFLRELTVPAAYGEVPAAAFLNCRGLRKIVLAEGIRTVGMMAFQNCGNLEDVTIPASVAYIWQNAFPDECAAVFRVVPGSAAEQYCRGKGYRIASEE